MIERFKNIYLRAMMPLYIFGLFFNPVTAIVSLIVFSFMIIEKVIE